MGFESSKNENVDPEVVLLAENLLQLHHSKVQTHTTERMSPTRADSEANSRMLAQENSMAGDDFRAWFNSPEGKAIMREYVLEHTINQIGEFADMEKLEELYLQFKNRTLH